MSTADTIIEIPLEQLHESPFNPRKTFLDVTGLAKNIQAEGRIHQPLLVRPRRTNPLRDDVIDGYELVFGHRRLRAAPLAGLVTAPCMVRELTDAEARSAQIAENLAREDVHPIEEAEGFAAMLEHDGLSADELAALVGKSRSYVYGRLKLLQAVPTVRDACLRGTIGSEVALLVARVGPAKLQEKALARISAIGSQHLQDGGQASYRRIKAELAEHFTLELKGAIFDREDAELLPGAGTCSACPKRTGNSVLFEDVAKKGISRWEGNGFERGEPNRCTDPDCWEAKTKAHLARGAAKLEAEGKVVVTGNKARQALDANGSPRNGYLPLERVKAELKKAKAEVPVVHVQDQRTGKVVKTVRHEDLVAAGLVKPEKKPAKADQRESAAARDKRQAAEYEARRQKAEAATEANRRLLLAVRTAAASRERTEFELRLLAAAALASTGYDVWPTLTWLYDCDMQALKQRVDTMTVPELTQVLLDCAIVDHVQVRPGWTDKPGPLLALAEHYGIDADAAMQAPAQPAAECTPTPSTAAAGGKKRTPAGAAYWCKETGETWSGRGQKPAWLKAKLAAGFALEDFAAGAAKSVKDDAGSAGGQDAQTAGLFEGEEAHA